MQCWLCAEQHSFKTASQTTVSSGTIILFSLLEAGKTTQHGKAHCMGTIETLPEHSLASGIKRANLIKRKFHNWTTYSLKHCFLNYSSNWFPPTLIDFMCEGLIYDTQWQWSTHLWLNWVQCTTQMPVAASYPVCLDRVSTGVCRPADWQSPVIGFVGCDRPHQLKWLTASGVLCVRWTGGSGARSEAMASSL